MIAPAVVKAAIAVGVVGELATLAVAQVVVPVDRTAVWVAFLGFGGLLTTSLLTFLNQRAAAKEARDAAREIREATTAQTAKTEQIHDLVNSKDDKQTRLIAELTQEIRDLNRAALTRAEHSPAVGGVDVNMVEKEKP